MKTDCLTCNGMGKLLIGVANGDPVDEPCWACDGKGYTCNHEHIREAYNGSERLVNGERDDDIEYVGLWCSDCGQEISQGYLDYLSGKDKSDPRDQER